MFNREDNIGHKIAIEDYLKMGPDALANMLMRGTPDASVSNKAKEFSSNVLGEGFSDIEKEVLKEFKNRHVPERQKPLFFKKWLQDKLLGVVSASGFLHSKAGNLFVATKAFYSDMSDSNRQKALMASEIGKGLAAFLDDIAAPLNTLSLDGSPRNVLSILEPALKKLNELTGSNKTPSSVVDIKVDDNLLRSFGFTEKQLKEKAIDSSEGLLKIIGKYIGLNLYVGKSTLPSNSGKFNRVTVVVRETDRNKVNDSIDAVKEKAITEFLRYASKLNKKTKEFIDREIAKSKTANVADFTSMLVDGIKESAAVSDIDPKLKFLFGIPKEDNLADMSTSQFLDAIKFFMGNTKDGKPLTSDRIRERLNDLLKNKKYLDIPDDIRSKYDENDKPEDIIKKEIASLTDRSNDKTPNEAEAIKTLASFFKSVRDAKAKQGVKETPTMEKYLKGNMVKNAERALKEFTDTDGNRDKNYSLIPEAHATMKDVKNLVEKVFSPFDTYEPSEGDPKGKTKADRWQNVGGAVSRDLKELSNMLTDILPDREKVTKITSDLKDIYKKIKFIEVDSNASKEEKKEAKARDKELKNALLRTSHPEYLIGATSSDDLINNLNKGLSADKFAVKANNELRTLKTEISRLIKGRHEAAVTYRSSLRRDSFLSKNYLSVVDNFEKGFGKDNNDLHKILDSADKVLSFPNRELEDIAKRAVHYYEDSIIKGLPQKSGIHISEGGVSKIDTATLNSVDKNLVDLYKDSLKSGSDAETLKRVEVARRFIDLLRIVDSARKTEPSSNSAKKAYVELINNLMSGAPVDKMRSLIASAATALDVAVRDANAELLPEHKDSSRLVSDYVNREVRFVSDSKQEEQKTKATIEALEKQKSIVAPVLLSPQAEEYAKKYLELKKLNIEANREFNKFLPKLDSLKSLRNLSTDIDNLIDTFKGVVRQSSYMKFFGKGSRFFPLESKVNIPANVDNILKEIEKSDPTKGYHELVKNVALQIQSIDYRKLMKLLEDGIEGKNDVTIDYNELEKTIKSYATKLLQVKKSIAALDPKNIVEKVSKYRDSLLNIDFLDKDTVKKFKLASNDGDTLVRASKIASELKAAAYRMVYAVKAREPGAFIYGEREIARDGKKVRVYTPNFFEPTDKEVEQFVQSLLSHGMDFEKKRENYKSDEEYKKALDKEIDDIVAKVVLKGKESIEKRVRKSITDSYLAMEDSAHGKKRNELLKEYKNVVTKIHKLQEETTEIKKEYLPKLEAYARFLYNPLRVVKNAVRSSSLSKQEKRDVLNRLDSYTRNNRVSPEDLDAFKEALKTKRPDKIKEFLSEESQDYIDKEYALVYSDLSDGDKTVASTAKTFLLDVFKGDEAALERNSKQNSKWKRDRKERDKTRKTLEKDRALYRKETDRATANIPVHKDRGQLVSLLKDYSDGAINSKSTLKEHANNLVNAAKALKSISKLKMEASNYKSMWRSIKAALEKELALTRLSDKDIISSKSALDKVVDAYPSLGAKHVLGELESLLPDAVKRHIEKDLKEDVSKETLDAMVANKVREIQDKFIKSAYGKLSGIESNSKEISDIVSKLHDEGIFGKTEQAVMYNRLSLYKRYGEAIRDIDRLTKEYGVLSNKHSVGVKGGDDLSKEQLMKIVGEELTLVKALKQELSILNDFKVGNDEEEANNIRMLKAAVKNLITLHELISTVYRVRADLHDTKFQILTEKRDGTLDKAKVVTYDELRRLSSELFKGESSAINKSLETEGELNSINKLDKSLDKSPRKIYEAPRKDNDYDKADTVKKPGTGKGMRDDVKTGPSVTDILKGTESDKGTSSYNKLKSLFKSKKASEGKTTLYDKLKLKYLDEKGAKDKEAMEVEASVYMNDDLLDFVSSHLASTVIEKSAGSTDEGDPNKEYNPLEALPGKKLDEPMYTNKDLEHLSYILDTKLAEAKDVATALKRSSKASDFESSSKRNKNFTKLLNDIKAIKELKFVLLKEYNIAGENMKLSEAPRKFRDLLSSFQETLSHKRHQIEIEKNRYKEYKYFINDIKENLDLSKKELKDITDAEVEYYTKSIYENLLRSLNKYWSSNSGRLYLFGGDKNENVSYDEVFKTVKNLTGVKYDSKIGINIARAREALREDLSREYIGNQHTPDGDTEVKVVSKGNRLKQVREAINQYKAVLEGIADDKNKEKLASIDKKIDQYNKLINKKKELLERGYGSFDKTGAAYKELKDVYKQLEKLGGDDYINDLNNQRVDILRKISAQGNLKKSSFATKFEYLLREETRLLKIKKYLNELYAKYKALPKETLVSEAVDRIQSEIDKGKADIEGLKKVREEATKEADKRKKEFEKLVKETEEYNKKLETELNEDILKHVNDDAPVVSETKSKAKGKSDTEDKEVKVPNYIKAILKGRPSAQKKVLKAIADDVSSIWRDLKADTSEDRIPDSEAPGVIADYVRGEIEDKLNGLDNIEPILKAVPKIVDKPEEFGEYLMRAGEKEYEKSAHFNRKHLYSQAIQDKINSILRV